MTFAGSLSKLTAALRAPAARPRNAGAAMPAPLIVALEPRIVYDASAASIGAAAVAAQHHASADTSASSTSGDAAAGHSSGAAAHASHAGVNAAASTRAVHGYTAAVTGESAAGVADASAMRAVHGFTATVAQSTDRQVVFVNSNVSGYQTLVSGLPQGTQVVILDSTKDGLVQIEQYLEQHPGVGAIHLVSHGSDGNVQIGSTWLNQGDLSAYSAELAQIGAAMKPGGDFLIYGCDVAQNADGKALVQQIASISGLNVAASTDATGAAALGGDWTLEYDAGTVHTPVIFSTAAEQQYGALLSVTDETYDGHLGFDTTGGAAGVTSFSLDGITYTMDQASEFSVDSTTINQGGAPALSTGPSDGVLVGNVQGTPLTTMTISLQNGDKMAIQSFDLDTFDGAVRLDALNASGVVVGTVSLNPAGNGGTFHVDVSSNPAFSNITSLRFVETDGYYLSPTLNNFTYVDLSSPPAMTASGGSTSFVEADNVASTPVAIDSGMTLTDGDATTAKQGTVSITSNFASGQDVLGFTNTSAATYGDISAAYNATTGVMTLTSASGTATITQWQNAFRAVTYTDTAAASPNTATRTISFGLATDAYFSSSNTVTKNVTVTATDQTPIVHATGGTTSYSDGTSPITIDSGVTVSDADNTTQASGTVSISGGFHSGDTLSFTNDGSTMGNIAASYSAATGVMTLTSAGNTATDAQWGHALSAVTFASTSPTYGARTISFATSDGTKTSTAATDTINVVNPVQVTTDSGSASFVAGDNTASTPVVVDSGLTVTDTAVATLGSATVAITGNFASDEDVLAFTNDGSTMGNIAGSYNSGTGLLTLTSSGATATLAQWQSALRSVTYSDTRVMPSSSTRTVGFTVVDSLSNTSTTSTRTVTVTDTDQTPIVTTTGGTMGYVGGTSAATVDGHVTVSDLDNTTQSSGTVSVTSGFNSGDTLTFVNTNSTTFGNIVASYNAGTGVLTLSSTGATATDTQWSNALSAVTFSASSSAPPGNRTISFTTNDGTKTSAAATDTVDVLGPPTITTDSGSAAFVAGDNVTSTPVTIDSGLTLTDASASTLGSATVAITGNFHSGEDLLAFTNTNSATFGNIAASYNAATGVLTMTSSGATATLAQWQAALDAVTYTDTAVTPSAATRTISFTAVDSGANTSNTATRTVTVADTDQTPIVTTTGGTTNYVGGTSAATVDGHVTVGDLDNTTQSSGTVSVTSGFNSGDTLTFVNTNSTTFGNIVASYNAGTGVLTLSSTGATATDAQWSNALSAVTFSASSSAPPGNRTISFTTNDGTKTSAAATDTVDVLGPPTITTDSGSAAFVAGDNVTSTPVTIDSGLTLTDASASTLGSATVAITGNFHSGEDLLAFTNTNAGTFGNIAASYNASTGVLTMTSSGATATLAQWQAALDAVTYTDTAVTPSAATRTISFTAVDSGANTSNTATRTVTVADTDQTPIVTTTGGTTNYVGGTSAATVDGHVTVGDLDNTTQSSGTVSVTSGFNSGDTLTFVNTNSTTFGNIVASYNAGTGVLTLSSTGATATDAQWSNALSAVTFSASSSAPPGNRTISFTTNDGTKTSAAATDTVDVLGPPTITTDSGSAAFVAGDNVTSTPVTIDSGLTLTDASASTLGSATVAITGNFHSGEDLLAFTNTNAGTFGNIAASYNASTGVLTMTSSGATATVTEWQAALDAVTYTDTAVTPNNATRTISFTAVDSSANTSNTATRTVTVADTDQTPIVTATSGTTSYSSGSAPTIVNPHVSVTDRDNPTQASGAVSIGTGFVSGDVLSFTNTSQATFGNIAASYNAATGVLTLTSTGATATDAQWSNAMSAVTFSSSSASFGNRTISFATNDGTETSAAAGATVAFFDRPHVTPDSGVASFTSADNATSTPVIVSPGLTLTDASVSAGSTALSSASVTVTGGFHAGQDVLAFTNDGSTMGNIQASYNASTGVLTLTSAGGTATLNAWRSALASVTYTDTAVVPDNATRTISFAVTDRNGTASDAQTRNVTVTDTDQTPTLSVSGDVTFTSQVTVSTPVAVAPQVTLGDRDPNATLTSAQVAISGGFDAVHDTLAFANASGTSDFSANYDANSGVLTLTWTGSGKPTFAQWQSALESVTYSNSGFRASGSRSVTFTITDGVKTSVAASNTIAIVTGRSGGTPTAALPAATTTTTTTDTSASRSTGSDNTGAPDVLDELGGRQPIGSVPVVPTMTFSDPSAPTGNYLIDRATVSRFDAAALDAALAVTQSSEMFMSASEIAVPVPEYDPFSIDVATLLPPSQALRDGASDVTVQLANGRSLPGWLHYDAASGVLRGKVPPGVEGVRIVVELHDASGHVSRRDVVLAPNARSSGHDVAQPNHGHPHAHPNPNGNANGHAALDLVQPLASRAARPAGKTSLDHQFAQARAALHVTRVVGAVRRV
ncbi:uncharacterized protein DUF4347 [Paraburkholderia sp. BL23I1N1]|uniref:DUF4347 domain-containing protein n=1 Tax=Paraburkholderia sp. BL23I1N1 TaxID=1938802 RepID=UPI000E70ECF4|nr:DUF4347 domain-containing protein [Paraburkholderia sp. BL23I1N1]RKE25170.1 uncharacterized protein DUF4347 [Paraburkholderia sp. BL23I1N1]